MLFKTQQVRQNLEDDTDSKKPINLSHRGNLHRAHIAIRNRALEDTKKNEEKLREEYIRTHQKTFVKQYIEVWKSNKSINGEDSAIAKRIEENLIHDSQQNRDYINEAIREIKLSAMNEIMEIHDLAQDYGYISAIKAYQELIDNKKVNEHMVEIIDIIVELWGYENLNSFWFERMPHELNRKASSDEEQYWKTLHIKTRSALDKIFPGLFMNWEYKDNKNRIMSDATADDIRKIAVNHLPITEKKYKNFIKAILELKSKHLVDMFSRKHESARSRAIAKHIRRDVDSDANGRKKRFAKIRYIIDGEKLIYNPSPEICEKCSPAMTQEAYVILIDADINKCPLFSLPRTKDFDSALLKSFNTENLQNPENILDLLRCKILFPPINPLEHPYKPDNQEREALIQKENLIKKYKEIRKNVANNNEKIIEYITETKEISQKQKSVLLIMHKHYAQDHKERMKKINAVHAQIIEFWGSTEEPNKTKDGFINGPTNEFSDDEIPRYKIVSVDRPTYNIHDLLDNLTELKDIINSCEELKHIANELANTFISTRRYWRKQILVKTINHIKKSPILKTLGLLNGIVNFMLKKMPTQIDIHVDRGALYKTLKKRLIEKQMTNGNDFENKKSFVKAIELMEELDEMIGNSGKDHPYLEYNFSLDDHGESVQVPDMSQLDDFKEFGNAGAQMDNEIQIYDFLDPVKERLNHTKYKERQAKGMGEANNLEAIRTSQSELNFNVKPFKQFIIDMVDLFLNAFHFDYSEETIPARVCRLNKKTKYYKPMSVKENCIYMLLRIIQEEKNFAVINEIKSNKDECSKLVEFVRIVLDKFENPNNNQDRLNKTITFYVLRILSDEKIEFILNELNSKQETKSGLMTFLKHAEAMRSEKLEKLSKQVEIRNSSAYNQKLKKYWQLSPIVKKSLLEAFSSMNSHESKKLIQCEELTNLLINFCDDDSEIGQNNNNPHTIDSLIEIFSSRSEEEIDMLFFPSKKISIFMPLIVQYLKISKSIEKLFKTISLADRAEIKDEIDDLLDGAKLNDIEAVTKELQSLYEPKFEKEINLKSFAINNELNRFHLRSDLIAQQIDKIKKYTDNESSEESLVFRLPEQFESAQLH